MIVWLWEAPGDGRAWLGVSGEEEAAKRAALPLLRAGRADRVRVEQAVIVLGTGTLEDAYQRTGRGWLARRSAGSGIRWTPCDGTPLQAPAR